MPADIITNITNSWAVEQGKVFNSIGNYTTWFRVREDADLADVQAKVKALLHKNYDASWGAEKVDAWKAYRMDEAFFFTGSSNGLTRTALPHDVPWHHVREKEQRHCCQDTLPHGH